MLESTVESWMCKELEKFGVRNIKLRTTGWPDRAFFANGLTCFVEFKRPKKKVTNPHQVQKAEQLTQIGFPVFVINEKSNENVKKILQALGFDAIFK